MTNDLIGVRFGRLEVIQISESAKSGHSKWLCKCDCGGETIVLGSNLRRGHTTSCGCLHQEKRTKHGKSKHRLYTIWAMMKRRCLNKKSKDYSRYGGRGISVCSEWIDNFSAFYDWAMKNGYRSDLSLDRANNDGSYNPPNCRWTTVKEQQNNTRCNKIISHNGKSLTIAQWSEELGIPDSVLRTRIKRGWSVERAFSQPVKAKRGKTDDAM